MNREREVEIDRDKVRAEARKLDGTGLRVWLDRAIDMLLDEAFPDLIADEAGSWQVGVLWGRVLPAWFRSLSPTTEAYDWAEAVVDALNDFASYQMDEILDAARAAGTREQKEALAEYEDDLRRRR